jgi:Mn2+/Fe2+ NRAMP family transporter
VRADAGGRRSALAGAAFLMATSAVGPGFLTQTALFTSQLGASFGFVIAASVLLDLAAQLTVWRVLVAAGRPAGPVADAVLPGLGRLLAWAVVFGGLAFNVGNVAGAGLGLEAMLGVPAAVGATLSAALAVALFLTPRAGPALDRFAAVLGALIVVLIAVVVAAARPPLGEALLRTVAPTRVDPLAVVTLVGGTVGGYITFAGAHRLLDAGARGPAAVPEATRGAALGIGVASLVRVGLFLAALGVVAAGGRVDPANPPASVFRLALGGAGMRLFGLLMWAAAVTSVVGSAYTSVSFLRGVLGAAERRPRAATAAFVGVSAAVFLAVGRPVRVLVLAGAINGWILPLALAAMLLAARRPAIVGTYRHPTWLTGAGWLTVLLMSGLAAWTGWSAVAAAIR